MELLIECGAWTGISTGMHDYSGGCRQDEDWHVYGA